LNLFIGAVCFSDCLLDEKCGAAILGSRLKLSIGQVVTSRSRTIFAPTSGTRGVTTLKTVLSPSRNRLYPLLPSRIVSRLVSTIKESPALEPQAPNVPSRLRSSWPCLLKRLLLGTANERPLLLLNYPPKNRNQPPMTLLVQTALTPTIPMASSFANTILLR